MNGTIYVDFDDVLSETARSLADISATRFGKKVRFEDIVSFSLDESFGLNAAEQDILFALFHETSVLSAIPPVPGAAEGMQAWAAAGCVVHIVTGRPPETLEASRAWLATHHMPYADITFVDKYHRGHTRVPGVRQMTLESLAECDFALAVDDAPEMVRFLASRTQVPVALFDRPWNSALQDEMMREDVVRCRSWDELMARFPCPGDTVGEA